MAERRMFAKTIVLSDAFLDMPMSARCLYFTLGMLADDDGFVNSPKSIMRQCGASVDDMNILLAKKFVLSFEDGVIVIKHWRVNNYLRNDRYVKTKYLDERAQLEVDENGSYQKVETVSDKSGIPPGIPPGIPTVYPGKDSIGKVSIVEDSIDNINNISTNNNKKKNKNITTSTFKPPTVQDVTEYCLTNGLTYVNPEAFIDFYESKNWMVGKNKMSKWKSALSGWNRRAKERGEKEFHIVPETPQHDDRPERWKTCPDSLWQKLKPYAHDDGSFDWPDFDTSVLAPEDREWMRRNDM